MYIIITYEPTPFYVFCLFSSLIFLIGSSPVRHVIVLSLILVCFLCVYISARLLPFKLTRFIPYRNTRQPFNRTTHMIRMSCTVHSRTQYQRLRILLARIHHLHFFSCRLFFVFFIHFSCIFMYGFPKINYSMPPYHENVHE